MAYVRQEQSFYPFLTVRETLLIKAGLRLDRCVAVVAVAVVDAPAGAFGLACIAVLRVLGCLRVQHSELGIASVRRRQQRQQKRSVTNRAVDEQDDVSGRYRKGSSRDTPPLTAAASPPGPKQIPAHINSTIRATFHALLLSE